MTLSTATGQRYVKLVYLCASTEIIYVVMMVVAPNSLVHQEGAQGEEEEEEAGGRRRVGSVGTPTPGAEVQLSQGCRMRGTGEDMDGGVGRQSTGGAEGARDQGARDI